MHLLTLYLNTLDWLLITYCQLFPFLCNGRWRFLPYSIYISQVLEVQFPDVLILRFPQNNYHTSPDHSVSSDVCVSVRHFLTNHGQKTITSPLLSWCFVVIFTVSIIQSTTIKGLLEVGLVCMSLSILSYRNPSYRVNVCIKDNGLIDGQAWNF